MAKKKALVGQLGQSPIISNHLRLQSVGIWNFGESKIFHFERNRKFSSNSNMAKKKAQSSMEFLILMGFLTIVIIGIVSVGFFYSSTITDRIELSQSSNYANKIVSTTETVFYAGEPSRATVSAHLPKGVSNIQVIENSIVITQKLETGTNVIAYRSDVPIAENSSAMLTTIPGIKNIMIVANDTHAIISEN